MSADDDLNLEDDDLEMTGVSGRKMSVSHESKGISFFGPRQVKNI